MVLKKMGPFQKNRTIYLVIMFTPRAMIIKMSKMASLFVFFADECKKSHSLGKTFTCISKISFGSLRKYYELFGF